MEIVDNSEKPRANEDLEEALKQVEQIIVTQITKIPPNLAVYMPTIREALIELLNIRKML